MAIKELLIFEGTATLQSALHIGGNGRGTQIGDCDNPIIRNPITMEPFIPGTSIKGALRSLEESKTKYNGKLRDGKPCGCGQRDCVACKLFGAYQNTRSDAGLSRLIVHDMTLNQDFKNDLLKSGDTIDSIIGIRTSTMINRKTGTADNRSLRTLELVQAGTIFDATFTLKILDSDNKDELIKELRKLVDGLEVVGIGAKTSSGLGQIKFDIDWEDYREYKV